MLGIFWDDCRGGDRKTIGELASTSFCRIANKIKWFVFSMSIRVILLALRQLSSLTLLQFRQVMPLKGVAKSRHPCVTLSLAD